MTELQELVKDAPKFASMERGELVAYAYAMYAAGVKMDAENAELRKLVRDMRTCIDHACYCEFCPLFVSEDMNERRCIADVKAHMRELGLEDE